MPLTEPATSLLLILPFTAKDEMDAVFQIQKLTEFQLGIGKKFAVVYICDDVPTRSQLLAVEKIKKQCSEVIFISHGKNLGKGAALKTGMQLSTNYTHALYTDIDFPYTLKSMFDVYDFLVQGNDFVIGVRNLEGSSYPVKQRRVLSSVLRWVNRTLIGKKWEDTQAGLKAYSSRACSIFQFLSFDRYLFDWQCVRLAARAKDMQVKLVEIQLREGYSQKLFSMSNLLKECKDVMLKIFKSLW